MKMKTGKIKKRKVEVVVDKLFFIILVPIEPNIVVICFSFYFSVILISPFSFCAPHFDIPEFFLNCFSSFWQYYYWRCSFFFLWLFIRSSYEQFVIVVQFKASRGTERYRDSERRHLLNCRSDYIRFMTFPLSVGKRENVQLDFQLD